MGYHLWQAIAKTALITVASAALKLSFLDAVFVLMSTDVIHLLVSRYLET
jgi:hypothetical protein